MDKKKDLLENLFKEASAYTSMDAIEALVESGVSLAQIPVQPIYLAIKALPMDKAALVLAKMSSQQRQACMDIDLWVKDNVDTEEFGFWVKSFSLCEDEDVRQEFVSSPEFFLYLKSRFNVWTFDVEEPEYPDHDNYFLTDDSLLLFEFDNDFEYVNEIRSLIRELYGDRGVEEAYTYLFKMVSGTYMHAMEDEYQEKKERLRDLGFVDYYDSLEVENTFISIELLENFIKKKKAATANLDPSIANQNLHHSTIVAYKNKLGSLSEELSKVANKKRIDYLQFSFIRLVNSTLSFEQALKEGPIAMSRVGTRTRIYLELGFDFLQSRARKEGLFIIQDEQSLFDLFDFKDLYQLGKSLIAIEQKEVKKVLTKFQIEQKKEAFLGQILTEIIENAFSSTVKSISPSEDKYEEVNSYIRYLNFKKGLKLVREIIPFAHGFYSQIETLAKEGKIRDEFYYNYKLDEMDFECLLLTSLANFKLGHLESEEKKLGLTVAEYRKFASFVCTGESLLSEKELSAVFKEFVSKFGLSVVEDINPYLCKLLENHIEGYDFEKLPERDFLHVGGPILLNLN